MVPFQACVGDRALFRVLFRREKKGNWQRNTLEWEKGEGEVRKTKRVTRSFNHSIFQHQQISSPAYAADDSRVDGEN